MKPSAEVQLQFLQHVQRLFEDGDFVATYKFALLMSLAELAVEFGTDDGATLQLAMYQVADKFAEFYWPQTAPYASRVSGTEPAVLLQNQGGQATVVTALLALRRHGAATIAQAKQCPIWHVTVKRVAQVVRQMPVKYLQNLGGVMVPFLYEYPPPQGQLVLKAGVPFLLRTFHALIQQLARAAWVSHVRQNHLNASVIGQADDLDNFMFGSSRNALASAGVLLSRLQSGKCFYCGNVIANAGEVDHFIPWSKYPRDLAHNFVLAHAECNRRKSDMLAAERHLESWLIRGEQHGEEIAAELANSIFIADQLCSQRVAKWAYEQGVHVGAHAWVKAKQTELLNTNCIQMLSSAAGVQ